MSMCTYIFDLAFKQKNFLLINTNPVNDYLHFLSLCLTVQDERQPCSPFHLTLPRIKRFRRTATPFYIIIYPTLILIKNSPKSGNLARLFPNLTRPSSLSRNEMRVKKERSQFSVSVLC